MEIQNKELQMKADVPESLAKLLIDYRGWEVPGSKKKKTTSVSAPAPALCEPDTEAVDTVEPEREISAVDEARRDGKVLGNQSGLYHTTDSPYYSRTKAEEFFDTVEEAEAAGYLHWDKKVRGEG